MLTLSYGRWIFLLSLAALMFILVSEVESSAIVKLDCCEKLTNRTFPRIKECYEQKRLDCKTHAYIIRSHSGRWRCIDPNAKELRNKIATGQLRCPSDISSPE
ncbi:uncharacterized protein FYW61_016350 [Anableps anableps]